MKDIIGYEGLYLISEDGRIWSIKKKIYIKEWIDKNSGYKTVRLHKNGKSKNFNVHRLLAIAFIPNPNCYPTVDHIDRNKMNNALSNLRWASHKMQEENKTDDQKKRNCEKLKHTCEIENNKRKKKVFAINNNTKDVVIFNSLAEAADATNSKVSCISRCINGIRKTHNGYTWKLAA